MLCLYGVKMIKATYALLNDAWEGHEAKLKGLVEENSVKEYVKSVVQIRVFLSTMYRFSPTVSFH
jgi:hypothetical protein